jgi:hypothetical protein
MHGHAHHRSRRREGCQGNGAIREFRDHAVAFVAVNGGLLALNLATDPHHLWALWPLLGWGIGFVSHAASAHGALRNERAHGPIPAAPTPPTPASEAERERPWPDLEER